MERSSRSSWHVERAIAIRCSFSIRSYRRRRCAPSRLQSWRRRRLPERGGRSLRPLWERPADPGRAVLLDLEMNEGFRQRGWRNGPEKVLWNAVSASGEVYDLAADPAEQAPLRLQSLAQNEVGRRAWEAFQAAARHAGHTRSMEEPEAMTHLLSELGYTEDTSTTESPH